MKFPIKIAWAIEVKEGLLIKRTSLVKNSDGKPITFQDKHGAETLAASYRNAKVVPYC